MKFSIYLILLNCLIMADTTHIVVDQRSNGGRWNSVGTYFCHAGGGTSVTIRTDGTNGYVIADAIMFVNGIDTIIVDDADSNHVKFLGSWTLGGGTPGYYGANYVHDQNTNKGSKSVCFTPLLPESGTYQLFLRWTEGGNRASNVPINIIYGIPSSTYQLTVIDGTGNGNYAKGQRITLAANTPPQGKIFSRWIADTLYLVNNFAQSTATTLMPAYPLTITAIFRDTALPPKSHFIENLEMGFPQKIVYLGTSITDAEVWTAPVDSVLSLRFPTLFSSVNSGVSGSCSRDGWKNIRSLALVHKPDAVIAEFSINDDASQLNLSLDSAYIYINKIIDSLLVCVPDCQIALMTMHPCPASNRDSVEYYYEMYRQVAAQRKLTLIDNYPHWKMIFDTDRALFNKLIPDGIHPTNSGGRQIIAPSVLHTLNPDTAMVSAETDKSLEIISFRAQPNPFNPVVYFSIISSELSVSSLEIFDISGRLIIDLTPRIKNGTVEWNSSACPTGVYYAILKTIRGTQKMKLAYIR